MSWCSQSQSVDWHVRVSPYNIPSIPGNFGETLRQWGRHKEYREADRHGIQDEIRRHGNKKVDGRARKSCVGKGYWDARLWN